MCEDDRFCPIILLSIALMLHQAVENTFTILPHSGLSNIDCIFISIFCYPEEEIDAALGEVITIFATIKICAWDAVYHTRPILQRKRSINPYSLDFATSIS